MRLLTPFLLTLPLFSTTFALPGPSPPGDENDSKNEHQTSKYDYVVVGSGPGGGPLANTLARAGHSVFLIEAGGDESHDISTELDSLFLLAGAANTSWGFYVSHYQDLETTLRYNLLTWKQTNGSLFVGTDPPEGAKMLGVYYPRGATLGGSAITNAKCVSLPSASDWDQIADLTGEEGWRAPAMREVFKRIERNVFVPADAPGHGFDGWLTVNQGSLAPYRTEALRNVYGALAEALGEDFDSAYELLQRDANSADLERDFVQGMYGLAFHVDEVWRRVSPRDILLPTANDAQFMLHLQLNSLATRVLLDRKKQRAIGVEYIEGVGIYGADRRYDPTQEPPEVKKVFARKEVIVAGGAFNSPQLLQLSGIGDCAHLEAVGVECLVHLPGVGRNLQENYEFPIVGTARTAAITDPSPCTGGAPGDPCLEEWIANKTGPYADAGANSNSIMLKTADAPRGERDVLVFTIAGGAFRGFVPPEFSNSLPPDAPSVFDMSTVKIHPGNKAGSVRIRSNDPREPPEIQFNFFSQGGEADLDALEEVVAWSRRALMAVPEPYGPFGNLEPPCPAGVDMETGYCADRQQDRNWIVDQAFGHHPTSTCPMGREDDPMAVLDGRLRLRGVDGLRVVDASAFPNIPGAFPVLPTFMLSQKAGEFILEELEKEKEPE